MKNFLCLAILFISTFATTKIYASAQNSLVQSVQYYDTMGNLSSTVALPSNLPVSGINGLRITLSTQALKNNFAFSSKKYDIKNFGIYFSSSITPGSGAALISCSSNSPCVSVANSNITIINDSAVNCTQSSSSETNYTCAGALNLILDIKGFTNNILPADMSNLFYTNSVAIGFFYSDPGQANIFDTADYAFWQPDSGTFVNGPTLQTHFNSVKAQQDNFQILNIVPPVANDAICPTADGITCLKDGKSANSLINAPNNNLSGYIVGIWNDSDCAQNPNSFVFDQNWMAYDYGNTYSALPACKYSLISYMNNVIHDIGGDTNSTILGCADITPTNPFLSGKNMPVITADTGAIPYLGNKGNAKLDLADIISNGTTPTKSKNSCIQYIYLKPSQTYTSSTIAPNSIYGVVIWALNSANDDSVPNYSLGHSNIVYTTTANFILSSIAKNSDIGLTITDCFVLTAASGNSDSPAVMYWRFLRDAYLSPIGITKFYYQHAKNWAFWLNQHPKFKKPLNYFFEKSGAVLFHSSQRLKKLNYSFKEKFHQSLNYISNLFDKTAAAAQIDNKNEPKDIKILENSMDQDPFFTESNNFNPKYPRYDFSISAGVLSPTQDKSYYDKYYSSQPTIYAQANLVKIFWNRDLGYTLGLQGRYLTNTQKDLANVLNVYEAYTRSFYALSAEAILGLHYRHPSFSYLQPGIFFGAGLTRFRESATAEGSTSDGLRGVTEISPIYEAGINLDLSLNAITNDKTISIGDIINEVLLRLTISYNSNPSISLSSSGYFIGAGFAFLIN